MVALTEQPVVITDLHIPILSQHNLALATLRLGLASTSLALGRPRRRLLCTFCRSFLVLSRSCGTVIISTKISFVFLIIISSGCFAFRLLGG
jgi:hypothetical protein